MSKAISSGETMRFKTYVWPTNPHTYKEERILEPEYSKDSNGNDVFNGMKDLRRRCLLGRGCHGAIQAFGGMLFG